MPAPTFNLPVLGASPNQYATEDGLETAINAALAEAWNGTASALLVAGTLPLINIGGTGDAIIADLAPALTDAGITALGTLSEVEYTPVSTNAAVNPMLTVGGFTYPIRNADAGTWPANGFVVGRRYTLRRFGGTLRVVGGDVTHTEYSAEVAARAALKPIASGLSMGNHYGQHIVSGQVHSGATFLTTPSGVADGFLIPDGQSGAASYISLMLDVSRYQGMRVFLRSRFRASLGFLSAIMRGPVRAQLSSGGAISNLDLESDSAVQQGDIIELTGVADIPSDAALAGVTLQVASNSAGTVGLREVRADGVEIGLLSEAGDELAARRRFEIRATDVLHYDEHPISGAAQALNGAVRTNDTEGAGIGISIPAGHTGEGSFVIRFFGSAGLETGDWLRVTTSYDVTEDFLDRQPMGNAAFFVRTAKAGANINRSHVRRMSQTGTVLTVVCDYQVQGDEYMLGPCLQIGAGGDTAVARGFTAAAMEISILNAVEGDNNATLRYIVTRHEREFLEVVDAPPQAFEIAITEAGPSFADAILASGSATARVPVQWKIAPGDYMDEANWVLPKHVEILADSAERPHVHYELPDDSLLNPASYQPFFVRDTAALSGLDVSVRNGRYAVHIEANGTNPDAKIKLKDCRFEHRGNVIGSWASLAALGMGVSSGWTVSSRDCVYTSPVFPFSWHNNVNFDAPALVENCRDTFVALTDSTGGGVNGTAIRIQPIGSGQRDQHVIEDCVIVGDILYSVSTWHPTELDMQPADHTEIQISGKGNSPAVFRIVDFGRALKIAAPDDINDAVSVSGDAVSVLMGRVKSYPGVTGLPAYVHGWADVSGVAVGPGADVNITSMGHRLGNLIGAPISMTVLVGAQSRTITFSADMTTVSNAEILNQINTALEGIAVASLYAVGERYRPSFADEERSLVNTQSYGIPMGSLLAYDGSTSRVRLMTFGDDPSLFAGVAWEDIYPATAGRVKVRGYLPLGDILRGDSAAVAFGTTFSVSATAPGAAVVGGAQGVLRGIRASAVEVMV